MSEPQSIDFSKLRNHNYVMNKPIFYSMLGALLLIFLTSVFIEGLDTKVYAKCSGPGWCANPFYERCDDIKKFRGDDDSKYQALRVCDQEFLFAGTVIGEPQSNFLKFMWLLEVIVIGFCVLLNHFLFNRPSQIKARKYLKRARQKEKW